MPPVEDHPVHEKTKIGADWVYKCNNRKPFADGYYAKDRIYRGNGTFYEVLTYIKHATSQDCRYDLYAADSACFGCRHGGGHGV